MADINRYFIGPLLLYKPEMMSTKDWLEHLFHRADRDIVRYVVDKRFTMPGLLYVAPTWKIQGIGYREVTPGTILWVRTDAKLPDSVDVEWQGGQGEKDLVYQLTASEWNWVKLHITEQEKQRKK